MPRRIPAPFGPAATAVLRDEIARAKGGDPMAPVSVAVPSNYAGLSLRRSLARADTGGNGRAGLVNVRFESLARIAEMLGGPALAAAGRRPLTTSVRAEALRATLVEAPGLFAAVASHQATERVLDRAFTELRACSPSSLDAIALQSHRAAEVVRLFRSTWARLAADWYDEHDLARAAAEVVVATSSALADVGRVIVFCPRRTTPALELLLDALGDHAVVIEGTFDPDHPPAGTRIIDAGDPDEEVRAAIREVMARVAAGTPLHRMALLLGSDTPYARLAHHQLAAAGIPHNGPSVRTLAQTVAGTALLRLLDLPAHDWRRDDVAAWLAAAPVLDDDGTPVPATAWDVLSRTAGIVGGAEEWDTRLGVYIAARDDELAEAADDPEVDEAKKRRIADNRDRATALRSFVGELITAVDPGERASWAELSAWACGLLDRYLGGEDTHGSWPAEEQDAWREVRGVLERLAGLDAVGAATGGLAARARPDLDAFLRAAHRELEAPAGRLGTFGDGLFVAHLSAAMGMDLDTVVVVGMAEGTVPARPREDPLLPDAERRVADGELALRAGRLDDEHRDFLAAIAAASGDRILVFPRSDLRAGRVRLPSRWLLDTATALHGDRVYSEDLGRLAEDGHPAIVAVASFEAGLREAPEPASLHDYDLRSLARWDAAHGLARRHPLAEAIPRLGRGLHAVRERRSERFTRFDGNLPAGSVAVPGPDQPVSPTSMQTYAACPFRYFMEKVLGLSESERPEDVIRLSATERGTMVHRILERFVAGRIAGEDGSIDRLQAIAGEEFASTEGNGITGKALLWEYDQEVIRRELHQFHGRDTLTPVAVEMDFGRQGGTPVTVTLDDGRQLAFKGSADRVDRAPDGHLVVTDYKTGSTYGYGGLDTKDAVARGEKLQLPIYGLAARELYGDPDTPVEARYWFVSEKGEFAAKGYTLDDERLARFRSVLGVITEGIADGNFPARPGEENTRPGYGGFDNCSFCSFDALCARERDRHWDRKKVSVELRPYVALAEGPLVAPGEDGAAS